MWYFRRKSFVLSNWASLFSEMSPASLAQDSRLFTLCYALTALDILLFIIHILRIVICLCITIPSTNFRTKVYFEEKKIENYFSNPAQNVFSLADKLKTTWWENTSVSFNRNKPEKREMTGRSVLIGKVWNFVLVFRVDDRNQCDRYQRGGGGWRSCLISSGNNKKYHFEF